MNSKLRAIFIGEFTWRRLVRSLILVPIAVIVGLLIIATFFADRVIFRPPSPSYRDDADVIKIDLSNGEAISAKYYENPEAEYTILFSHGNAEDLGLIEPFVRILRDSGFNVLAYDYRGYGTSNGLPTEENAYADISAAYDFLLTEKGTKSGRILVHGRSLGGAVAVDLASREKVAGLILESTFTSAFRVVTRYRVLPFDKFESINKIKDVRCPVLVIHGTNDWTIPSYHGEMLLESAKEPKQAYWVEGAEHNDVFYRQRSRYLETIERFARTLPSE